MTSQNYNIISYDRADKKLKAEMDRIIDRLVHASDRVLAVSPQKLGGVASEVIKLSIMIYGHSPLKKLDDGLWEIIKLQNEFNKAVNAGADMWSAMSSFVKATEKVDLERREATRELGVYLGASQKILKHHLMGSLENDFIDRVSVLETSYEASVMAGLQLSSQVYTMKALIKTAPRAKKKPGGKFTP